MFYILLVVSLLAGWWAREIFELLKSIRDKLNTLKMAEKEPDKPSSSFGDEVTPAQLAAIEERDRIRKLNNL